MTFMRALVTSVVLLAACQPEPLNLPDASVDTFSASCSDGAKNGGETDVDCGGSCGACALGKSCAVANDCANGTCFSGSCAPRMWFATSTGSNVAVPGSNVWTAAPGLSVQADLHAASTVLIRWTGTSRFVGGGNELCHLGQRFVIDGVPTGNPTWGDNIVVQRGTTRWHEPFASEVAVSLAAGSHTITAEMTNGTGNATCNLDGDGGLEYDRSQLAVVAYDPATAWSAESTGTSGVLAPGSAWTDIPGATTSILLPDRDVVQMSLSGSQLAQPGTSGTYGHCAYRLVLDDVPVGDASHGQSISVGDVGGGWWAPVAIKYGLTLAAGGHTIRAQVRNSGGTDGTCEAAAGNQQYSRFRLFVTASPSGGGNVALESTGAAQYFPPTSPWTTIAGLSATIVTHRTSPSTVLFEVAGTQRTLASGTSYCGYRIVVDGVAQGHPNHGQAISVGDSTYAWWSYVGLTASTVLAPGPHDVSVEARNSSAAGDCGVNGDDKAYGRVRLLVRNL
jgi:hypothetical protein